jgi:Glycosyl hydrolase family 95 catalytic domain/Glycosyl hydrolase family 65, N-terminal domain/Glycoside hydrolase family 95, C-terminal domain
MYSIQPATRWEDALPIGNGSIGALVYGNICSEKIIFNHEALWFRYPKKEAPYIADNLEELRGMLTNGEWAFSDRFLDFMLKEQGYNAQTGFSIKDRYHPAFDLIIDTEPKYPFKNFLRTLDFESGEAIVAWEEKDVKFERKSFVSRDNDLFVLKYSSSEEITCHVTLQETGFAEENRSYKNRNINQSNIPLKFEKTINKNMISIVGTYDNGNKYGGLAYIVPEDKVELKLETKKNGLEISGAKNLLIIVKIFVNDTDSGTALQNLQKDIEKVPLDYEVLRKAHWLQHFNLYHRLTLNLFFEEERQKTNEILLLESYNGNVSQALVERMFNYGRYLLISSSRPEGWPANLQGVWNGDYQAAWESDYHNDENIQMNYWAALPGNQADTTLPYFDYYEACIADNQRNAKAVYNCRGIMVPIAQTYKGEAPLYGGPWLNWTSGAGWLSQLFYDYWLFTRDDEFLKNRAIPYLTQVALFYEDFLYKGDDGKLIFCPSLSPENVPDFPGASLVTINATMDVAVCKEVLTNLIEGSEHLHINSEEISKWKDMMSNLPEYEINEDGAIREWLYPGLKDNYQHRHISHIYGLFPGFEITQMSNPKMFEACKIAVEKRLAIGHRSQSGWSLAHLANIFARLNDGDRALDCIENLSRSSVGPNLFTYHNDWRHQGLSLFWDFKDRIYQIDANFGITAAVIEMLAYSNRELIKILPALPEKWPKGEVAGIQCRSGSEICIEWNRSDRTVSVEIRSKFDQTLTLKLPSEITSIESKYITDIADSTYGKEYREVALKSNQAVMIDFKVAKL